MAEIYELINDDVKFNIIMHYGVTRVSTSLEIFNSVLDFLIILIFIVFNPNPSDQSNLLSRVYQMITR